MPFTTSRSPTLTSLMQFSRSVSTCMTFENHSLQLKRILRYIRGTLYLGLVLRSSSKSDLVVYSDADWAAGSLDTRKSTSGYAVFLGDKLVSWSSKNTISCSCDIRSSSPPPSSVARHRRLSQTCFCTASSHSSVAPSSFVSLFPWSWLCVCCLWIREGAAACPWDCSVLGLCIVLLLYSEGFLYTGLLS